MTSPTEEENIGLTMRVSSAEWNEIIYFPPQEFKRTGREDTSINGTGLLDDWKDSLALVQGLKPMVPVESPPLVFAVPTKLASDASSPVEYLGKNRVPELQKFFQKPDGLPVYLKRGLPDQLLYRTTMALTIGGTIYCLIALYMAAQPQKQK